MEYVLFRKEKIKSSPRLHAYGVQPVQAVGQRATEAIFLSVRIPRIRGPCRVHTIHCTEYGVGTYLPAKEEAVRRFCSLNMVYGGCVDGQVGKRQAALVLLFFLIILGTWKESLSYPTYLSMYSTYIPS